MLDCSSVGHELGKGESRFGDAAGGQGKAAGTPLFIWK